MFAYQPAIPRSGFGVLSQFGQQPPMTHSGCTGGASCQASGRISERTRPHGAVGGPAPEGTLGRVGMRAVKLEQQRTRVRLRTLICYVWPGELRT